MSLLLSLLPRLCRHCWSLHRRCHPPLQLPIVASPC
ncbi:hypothetical protein MANES_07G063747v8 [Manihot esculenta]|uniref:Uncharacterized protein n=1 Tax=Manihot esculenta TaxID=3983 RepID=A0ACB7HDX9_MANES|nr:hypothetical protein MANES_07G063747v8 [Manihot esculenta]